MNSKQKDLRRTSPKEKSVIAMALLKDLRFMIEKSRQSVASMVNVSITLLYWHIGHRIVKEILQDERAEYGKTIIVTVSRQLSWGHFVALIPLKGGVIQGCW